MAIPDATGYLELLIEELRRARETREKEKREGEKRKKATEEEKRGEEQGFLEFLGMVMERNRNKEGQAKRPDPSQMVGMIEGSAGVWYETILRVQEKGSFTVVAGSELKVGM